MARYPLSRYSQPVGGPFKFFFGPLLQVCLPETGNENAERPPVSGNFKFEITNSTATGPI